MPVAYGCSDWEYPASIAISPLTVMLCGGALLISRLSWALPPYSWDRSWIFSRDMWKILQLGPPGFVHRWRKALVRIEKIRCRTFSSQMWCIYPVGWSCTTSCTRRWRCSVLFVCLSGCLKQLPHRPRIATMNIRTACAVDPRWIPNWWAPVWQVSASVSWSRGWRGVVNMDHLVERLSPLLWIPSIPCSMPHL